MNSKSQGIIMKTHRLYNKGVNTTVLPNLLENKTPEKRVRRKTYSNQRRVSKELQQAVENLSNDGMIF